jgi:hypothetical protein
MMHKKLNKAWIAQAKADRRLKSLSPLRERGWGEGVMLERPPGQNAPANPLSALLLALCLLLSTQLQAECRTDIVATAPDERFELSGEEVIDNWTGLIWQQCSLGQSGTDCSGTAAEPYTWAQALQAAQSQATTEKAWRLPNVKELRALVEARCHSPAINETFFPNTPSDFYWTSSPHATFVGTAWSVGFKHGQSIDADMNDANNLGVVRLVRDPE